MSTSRIETLRARQKRLKIRDTALCGVARVHKSTWWRLRKRRRGGHARTLDKLERALDALEADAGERAPA